MPWSHIEREWAIPGWRRRYERLAAGRRLVRFDARGFGLSELHPVNVTPAAHADDLEAVLNALTIEECDLFAAGDGGFGAIEYCAREANRVRRLILWGAYANRDALLNSPKIKSMHALWEEDWTQYTELAVRTDGSMKTARGGSRSSIGRQRLKSRSRTLSARCTAST